MVSSGGTRVVQVTNIAPQATKDQMQTLFGFLGKIDDIRLYPTVRDVSCPVASRICYLRYYDSQPAQIAQHMTNTVFIDRALIVVPVANGEIPDEHRALEMSSSGTLVPGLNAPEPRLPSHIINTLEGVPPNQVIQTHDPKITASGLPAYPPLPAAYDSRKIEEIRRTILIIDVPDVSNDKLIEFMGGAGEVKYMRFCTRDADRLKYVLVEFSEQDSVLKALQMHGSMLEGRMIKVHHATQAITKPQTKSNEAAQREIEEAMCRVKEAQNLISAAIDPVIGLLSKDKRRTRSRSRSRRRSRSKSRRRSRSRHRSRRSRSRHRTKRSRSRHRRSRSRSGHRSSRSKRSRSRSRHRSSRSKRDSSREKDKDKKEVRRKEKSKTPAVDLKVKTPPKDEPKENIKDVIIAPPADVEKRSPLKDVKRSRSRDKKRSKSKERRRSRSRSHRSRTRDRKRSRSRDRKRSRSRDRKRSRSHDRKRSRSRDRKRSRSRDRKRSRSRDKKRSRSRDRKRSRSRDTRSRSKRESKTPLPLDRRSKEKSPMLPVVEKGESPSPPLPRSDSNDEKNSPDNMDISNSP